MNRLIRFTIFLFSALTLNANASGTSVGNGGDPIFYFLESARYSLRETLHHLKNDPTDASKVCDFVPTLTQDQRNDCGNFARQIFKQILDLNSPQDPTAFVLRADSLMVDGPDGIPMPVAARTALGRRGAIEFHRSSIQFLSPSQMLLLMGHEFGHKVEFSGTNIQDNQPVMSFRRGRDLLDSFGQAVSYWAIQKGFIGSNFGLRDLFDCEVGSNAGKFRVRVSTPRKFKSQDFNKYEITMGHAPSDPEIEVPELSGNTLLLRLHVNESRSCLESSMERKSELEIVRHFADNPRTEIVAHSDFLGFNPVCDQTKQVLAIEAAGFRFSCLYAGTEGVTAKFSKSTTK